MSEEQKETQENRGVPFDLTSCIAMMEEMMGQQGDGCDSTEMMSQMAGQGDCGEMMFQMMASCCTVQGEPGEANPTDTSQDT